MKVRARTWIVPALLAGLSIAGCAPTLEGDGERGGTIHQNQLTQNYIELGPVGVGSLDLGDTNVVAIAGQYCSQYGRSAHITEQNVATVWPIDAFHFDCIQ
jgi:hypothetical protein